MAVSTRSKKSETIEVRLSFEAKTAFMEQCRAEQRTASEAIRLFIDERLAPSAAPRRPRLPHARLILAVAAGALVGAGAAAPSFAHARFASKAAFERLDADRDGVLSYAEFRRR